MWRAGVRVCISSDEHADTLILRLHGAALGDWQMDDVSTWLCLSRFEKNKEWGGGVVVGGEQGTGLVFTTMALILYCSR